MTDRARAAYAACHAVEYAAESSVQNEIAALLASPTTDRTQRVVSVLELLAKLAASQAGVSDRDRARWPLNIDIAHAHVTAVDRPAPMGAYQGLPPGAPALVRLFVTISIPPGGSSPDIGSSHRTGETAALLGALQDLAASPPARPDAIGAAAAAARPGALPPMSLAKVKTYIEQHLAERIQLEELAALTRLSVSRFISAFRCSTGIPPYRYLVQRRVAAAAVLIRETERSLTQIAQETGFSDQSHLCRSFAQVLRTTPRNYRRDFR